MTKDRKSSLNDCADEFRAFMAADDVAPPPALSEKILETVTGELNPSPWKVFSRLAGIHTVVGALSLVFICPQFGMSPLGHTAVMEWFMRFGHEVCMLGCGAVFLGGSTLAMSFVLRPEEIGVIRKTRFVQLGLLALLSIGAFLCAGAGVVASLGAFWILGSIAGGIVSLELGWALRSRLAAR